MNVLIDMNLSPQWCEILRAHGHEARHWSQIGDIRAGDEVILAWPEKMASLFSHVI